jgi:pilus assembly protein CpaE
VTSPEDAQILVGVVDRTGELFDGALSAADRLGLSATVEELEHASFGPESARQDIVVLGPRELSRAALRRAARYSARHPACVLVAIGVPSARENANALTAAELRGFGVRVATRGVPSRAKLLNAMNRAVNELERFRSDALEGAPLPVHGGDGAELAELEPEGLEALDRAARLDALEAESLDEANGEVGDLAQPPTREHRETALLVTIASATGGCGKTFFGTNFAAIVAAAGYRCLLVDLDLQFGEVAAALRIRHPYSVYDGLYDSGGKALPSGTLEDHLDDLLVHHSLGFDVLTAPRDPALADYVGARDASTILDAVEPLYDVVVVDTPPSLNEVVLTALDRSDVVTVLATLDVPSLKNLTVFLDTLARLRLDKSRLRLVLNKVEADIGISVAQAQDAFEGRFLAGIPMSRGVSRAINAGTVVVKLEPRASVAQQLQLATRALLPPDMPMDVPQSQPTNVSPLARLFAALRPSRRVPSGGAP